VRKNFVPESPLDNNHPFLLTSTSVVKNYDIRWELGCFHKASDCWKTH